MIRQPVTMPQSHPETMKKMKGRRVEGWKVRKSKKIRQNFMSQKYCYNWASSFRPKNSCKKNKKLKDM